MSYSGRIIQIIPANGWFAKYKMDDGTIFKSRLVCWALTADEKILGMEADSTGWIDSANGTSNFLGFVHEDNKEEALDLVHEIEREISK